MARKISKHLWRWPAWHAPTASALLRVRLTSCRVSITIAGPPSARRSRGYVRVFWRRGYRSASSPAPMCISPLILTSSWATAGPSLSTIPVTCCLSHHIISCRDDSRTSFLGMQAAGYVPIVTHPERLSWIEGHYDLVKRLVCNSVLMQITAGSLMGRFGRRPRYWAERMLDDGLCHVLATDAHDTERRPPRMAEARELVAQRLGRDEATHLVLTRPRGILNDLSPADLPPPLSARAPQTESDAEAVSALGNILKRVRRMAGAA